MMVRRNAGFYLLMMIMFTLVFMISYSPFNTGNYIYAEAAPASYPYAYDVNISVKPIAVYALTPQKIFLVGRANGSTVVEILNVSDPLTPPKIIQSYPLVGNPTAVATNGYPITRIAVGTDAGDLVLFKIGGGRVHLLLHAVLGTDFAVRKLLVLKGTEDYKLAVLAAEGKASGGGVCTKCHVYVFDELSGGALRIGLNEGNASLTINNVLPQDISAVLVMSNGNYYYDAQKFVITWLPAKFYITIINATISKNETIEPATHALVDVVTYSKTLHEIYHYGVNLGEDGTAEIPVPWGFDANLTLTDVDGRKYFKHVKAPNVSEVAKVYVAFKLNASPVTAEAVTLYKVPPYELAAPHIINVDGVPNSFSTVTSLNDTRINPASTGLSLLKGTNSSNFILYYYDPSTGDAHIKVYTSSFKATNEVTDYVGVKLYSLGAFTYPDEKIIVTAYKEGKMKYYIVSRNSYKFFYELTLGGALNRVEIVPLTEGYYYIAHTSTGLQVVRTYPYQVPILRYGTQVNYAAGSIDGDIGGNLNYGAVAYNDRLTILRNIASLIKGEKPVNLDSIRVPRLHVKVNPPKGLPVNGTKIYLIYHEGTLEKTLGKSNVAIFPNILPYENYTLIVAYPKPYVNKVILNITPTGYKDVCVTANLTYKIYSLTLNVRDSVSGARIIAPYDVLVNNKTVLRNLRNSTVTFPVIYGNYTITIRPVSGRENVYNESTVHVCVTRNTSASVYLVRKRYTLNIVVVDKYSKRLLAPVVVEITKNTSKIIGPSESEVTFILPYGNYTIRVYPPKKYSNIYVPTSITTMLSEPSTATIVLDRVKYAVNVTVKDMVSNASPLAPVDLIVDGKTLVRELRNTSIIMPMIYGNHTITVTPSKNYENIYEPKTTLVPVTKNVVVNMYLVRKRYTLNIVVVDKYSKRLLAPVVVEITKSTSKIIGFGGTKASFILPYGNYTIRVYPLKGYNRIYLPAIASVTLSKPSTLTLVLERVKYTLNISIKDMTTGILSGLFNVYINGSKVASGVRGLTNVTLPYGVYLVSVTPERAGIYGTPRPQIVKVFNNTEVIFKLSRKFFKIKIIIIDDVGTPVKNAEVKFFSIDKGTYISTLLTDDSGTVQGSLFYGGYRIDISAKGFYPTQRNLILNKDTELTLTLQPQLLTVIMRYSMVIIVVCIAAVAIVAILKIRARIAERLPKEELF